jgi:hypothetical protein
MLQTVIFVLNSILHSKVGMVLFLIFILLQVANNYE